MPGAWGSKSCCRNNFRAPDVVLVKKNCSNSCCTSAGTRSGSSSNYSCGGNNDHCSGKAIIT